MKKRPFVNFYAPNFILYELSSPFLNFHWCLDKLNLTGSRLQLINGVLLLASFLISRLILGPLQSFMVSTDIVTAYFHARSQSPAFPSTEEPSFNATLSDMRFAKGPAANVPLWLVVVYLASNLILNALNFYWYAKMITAIRKRFTGEKKDKKEEGGVLFEELESPGEPGMEKEKSMVWRDIGPHVTGIEKTEIKWRKAVD